MRLDQVDIDPAGAGRKSDTKIEIGACIAASGVEQTALDQILGRLQTVRHDNPLLPPPHMETSGSNVAVYDQQSVNADPNFDE
jgi:hypothetical protein